MIAVLLFSAIWLFFMILVPLRSRKGASFRGQSITIGVLAQVALVVVTLAVFWKGTSVARAVILVPVLGWTAEFIGSRTGIPFGRYHYTDILQPQLRRVPVVIPAAWLMMLPPSWAISQALFPEASPLLQSVVAGAAFTAWDVYLDPHLVGWRFWEWEERGSYLGIPLKNFLGWFLWATAITVVVAPPELPFFPLAVVYILTWLFQFGGHVVFWGMPISGLVGFIAMGVFTVPVLLRLIF